MMTDITAEDFVLKYRPAWGPDKGWGCIAGGYLRDAVLDVPWKDVDLFIYRKDKDPHQPMFLIVYEKDKTFGFWQSEYEPAIGWTKYLLCRTGEEAYDEERFVSFSVKEIPGLNVIFRLDAPASPEVLVSEFPCTASMVWIECGTTEVKMFTGFADSVRTKRFFYPHFGTEEYLHRMVDKFFHIKVTHSIAADKGSWDIYKGTPK